ncbi:MAG: phage/plasmid primase, P4 family [Eubacteriaceae bacterium]|nr:phage/plasmid primase, P4 family [Eubacteriaceae bacterium]
MQTQEVIRRWVANIPQILKQKKNWLITNGKGAPLNPIDGTLFDDWNSYESNKCMIFNDAVEAVARNLHGSCHIGFRIVNGEGITIIDFDDCRDAYTGDIDPAVLWWVKKGDTYTEISRSGTGLHVVGHSEFKNARSNAVQGTPWHKRIEYYSENKQIVITGNIFEGYSEINECSEIFEELYNATIGEYEQLKALDKPQKNGQQYNDGIASDVKFGDMLLFINCADLDYEDWLHVLMGLKHEGVSFEVADRWSATDPMRYDGTDKLRRKWDSFRKQGITGGTICAMAKLGGWTPARLYGINYKAKYTEMSNNSEINGYKDEYEYESRDLTETGYANRITWRYGNNIKYEPGQKDFYLWDSGYWSKQPGPEKIIELYINNLPKMLRDEGKAAADSIKNSADENADEAAENIKKAHNEAALKVQSRNMKYNVAELLKSSKGISIPQESFNSGALLLNCANCTIDLETGQSKAHDKGDLITMSTGIVFDPFATSPLWDDTLKLFLPDSEVREFLQIWFGYNTTGLNREKCFVLAYGGGNNGKSTIFNTVSAALGAYAKTASPLLFFEDQKSKEPPMDAMARIHEARMVVTSESRDKSKLRSEDLKRIVSGAGDRENAQFKHKDSFEFTPKFKINLLTNHPPQITDTTRAIWTRMRFIECSVSLTEEQADPTVPERLMGELPGVLNWLVEGAIKYIKYGLNAPNTIIASTDEYRKNEDSVKMFIEEMCEETTMYGDVTPSKILYDVYAEYCTTLGLVKVSQTLFGKRLKNDLGIGNNRKGPGWVYWVKVKSDDDVDLDRQVADLNEVLRDR